MLGVEGDDGEEGGRIERVEPAFLKTRQWGADLNFGRPGDGVGEPAEGLP